jgi:hypothetical protein
MTEIILQLLTYVSTGLSPVGMLFLGIAGIEAYYIMTKLREQTEKEKNLFDSFQELQKLHHDSINAVQEARIDDLKELVSKYDESVKAITDAFKRFK